MLVNAQLLDEKIAEAGLRIDYIIKNLGITDTAWYKKKNGTTPFRAAEVYVICDLCKISDDEKAKIFYPKGSVKAEQKGE